MKRIADIDLIEMTGGEEARAQVRVDNSIIELELWQNRWDGEKPYVIWLTPVGAAAIAKALSASVEAVSS